MATIHRGTRAALIVASILTASALRQVSAAEVEDANPDVVPVGSDAADLTNLSLEDLMNVEVTSVSKQKQRIAQAPAAVTVISQDDIRRSGMTSIPELLRMAPGVTVQQLNANVWQVGVRGFTQQFNNKLLVLRDGRTLYNPMFGGIYWDMQDYLLEDLERIEVIRGPGATLWGSNAVNGVINITSKSARDTQGLLLTGNVSNQESIGGIRYGGKIDDQTFYRAYGKYRRVDDFPTPAGNDADDGWEMPLGGFRIDRYSTPQDQLTLQGDIHREYGGKYDTVPMAGPPFERTVAKPPITGGSNILGRWTHTISADSDFSIQAYFDRTYRDTESDNFEQNTADLELQHRFRLDDRNEVIYGLGFRYLTFNSEATAYSNQALELDDYQFSAFVQDDVSIVPERLHLILGTKLENSSYGGWNLQPSARLLWTPDERHTVWAGVSRAVRSPSIVEREISDLWLQTVPTGSGLPARIQLQGDPDLSSEKLIAYELGYRVQPARDLSVDVTGFVHVYDDLTVTQQGTPAFAATPTPHLEIPMAFTNGMVGETYGLELAARWRPFDRLHLSGSYSLVITDLRLAAGTDSTAVTLGEEGTPRNQAQLHVRYEVTSRIDVNAAAYYSEQINAGTGVPSYVRVDLGATYRPTENAELSVGVRNLLDNQHVEVGESLAYSRVTEIPRTFYAQFTLRY